MQSAAESKVLVAWDERPRRGMAEHARDTVRGGVAETNALLGVSLTPATGCVVTDVLPQLPLRAPK